MKIIKHTQPSIVSYFQCEVCKKAHYSALDATNCEKSHTCKHEPTFEFIDASNDAWWFNVRGISATCKLCKTELGEIDFKSIEDEQNIMKTIYSLIEQHNKSLEPAETIGG